jgi:hypothetical protein
MHCFRLSGSRAMLPICDPMGDAFSGTQRRSSRLYKNNDPPLQLNFAIDPPRHTESFPHPHSLNPKTGGRRQNRRYRFESADCSHHHPFIPPTPSLASDRKRLRIGKVEFIPLKDFTQAAPVQQRHSAMKFSHRYPLSCVCLLKIVFNSIGWILES